MYSETLSRHVLSTQGKIPMLFSQRGKRLLVSMLWEGLCRGLTTHVPETPKYL